MAKPRGLAFQRGLYGDWACGVLDAGFRGPTVYVPNLLFILGLLAQAEVARRLPDRVPHSDSNVQHSLIVLGGLSLWLFVSRWVLEMANGFLPDRKLVGPGIRPVQCGIVVARANVPWLGLGILALRTGRVVIFDVGNWKRSIAF
jgi:hypothetical protein